MTKPKLRFKDKNGNSYLEWKNLKLKDICSEFIVPMRDKPKEFNGNIPWCRIEDIEGNFFHGTKSNQYVSQKIIDDMKLKIMPTGTVICSCSASLGTYAINTCPIITNQTFIGLVCSNLVSNVFLLNLMKTQTRKLKNIAGGTTIPYISREKFEEYRVYIPCLEEQEKIAVFLCKVDELINECEGEVKDLEEQKKGLMQKIFSQQIRFKDSNNNPYPEWEEKVMNDILNEYCKKSSISNQYPVLTSSKQGLMLQTEYYSGENRITEKDNIGFNIIPPNYITYRSRSDDGLFTFNINNLGVTGIVSTYYPVFSTNYNNLFVMTYLNINKNNLFKYAVGSSQKVLSLNELKKVKIKLPCLEEQEKIAKVLSKMDELIEEKKALLSDWQQFKKGLLQQMFV